ncbi:MAG: hypothetical protein JO283_00460 [Bradyrhizobium sp.]|nr:hypothetical protein [Bradyrhizobium sp.]
MIGHSYCVAAELFARGVTRCPRGSCVREVAAIGMIGDQAWRFRWAISFWGRSGAISRSRTPCARDPNGLFLRRTRAQAIIDRYGALAKGAGMSGRQGHRF